MRAQKGIWVMNDETAIVGYVTGRKKALVRALALHNMARRGVRWSDMSDAHKKLALEDADFVVDTWISNGVLASFQYPYREAETK